MDVESQEEGYEGEPYFLRLAYSSYQEATKIAEILEEIYGKGRILIESKSSEDSMTE